MASASQPGPNKSERSHVTQKHRLYTSLPTNEPHIRLLQIRPGDSEDPIDCTLSIHKLSNAPQYSAVSYVCGNPTPTKTIKVNGISSEVAINCQNVLWQLRSLGLAQYYWVDALCIHQNDLEEKGNQVQLMGRIFGSAQRVLGSVGLHDHDSRLFMQKVRTVPKGGSAFSSGVDQAWFAAQSQHDLLEFCSAAGNFAKRPYWNRLWIVQEIDLARDITLICGLDTLDFEPLFNLMSPNFLSAGASHLSAEGPGEKMAKAGDTLREFKAGYISKVTSARMGNSRVNRDRNLSELVTQYRRWQCTNPLDRIYGLLDLEKKRCPSEHRIIPDYTISTISLARLCLNHFYLDEQHPTHTFFSTARDLMEALELNMYHYETRQIIEVRQQRFIELCTADTTDAAKNDDAKEREAFLLASKAEAKAKIPMFLDVEELLFPIQESSDGGLITDFAPAGTLSTDFEPYSHALSLAMEETCQRDLQPSMEPRLLMSGNLNIALLCGQTQPGDYYFPLTNEVGHLNGYKFEPCLVVRRCGSGSLFELVGQGFVPSERIQPPPFPSLEEFEKASPSIALYFAQEDLLALASLDLCDRRAEDEGWLAFGEDSYGPFSLPPLQMERLFIAVTSEPFSSFAVKVPNKE